MGNSIYLGGGLKSAFCGGNVKEIWQGKNQIFGAEEKDRSDYVLIENFNINDRLGKDFINYLDANEIIEENPFGSGKSAIIKTDKWWKDSGLNANTDVLNTINTKTWTIEFWIKDWTKNKVTQIFAIGPGGSYYICMFINITTDSRLYVYGGYEISYPKSAVMGDGWHHLAFCRNGTKPIYCFLDGVKFASFSRNLSPDNTYVFFKNRDPDSDRYAGATIKVAEISVAKICKWTENFTPPTKPY